MFNDLPIQFERPIWLLLLVLIIPCYFLARRSIGGLSRGKATLTFALRVIVILLLTMALAEPMWEKRGEGLTVSIILDRSQSVPLPLKASSVTFLQKAVAAKENREDRVAVISIAKDAEIDAMPDALSAVAPGSDDMDLTATNLAAGLEMALAIMPDDTANRVLLVSDGNETIDSVMATAEIARANNVPVDVMVLEYEHEREIIFEKIIAPARARQGQSANVKLLLRGQNDAAGTILMTMNSVPVDLDPDADGDGLRVQLTAGELKTVLVPVSFDKPGPIQFDATFDPDNVADDSIDRNNSAVGVTFVGGEGRVLIIDETGTESEYLVRAMREANINVEVVSPKDAALAGGIVALAGYDAIVMANIPRHEFDAFEQDQMLHAYVHDLGGGFVMLGGPESFGAGGWIDSEVSKMLPVKLDPPQTKQQVRGALALIMHSCEMPQGNYWGQKVAISAIQALSSLDYVGICEYGWGGGPNVNGAAWAFQMQIAGDKSAAIAAAKKMQVGDMPDFDASMQLAHDGLMGVRAGQRHAIIISDGDPSPPTAGLLQKYIDAKITCTTIMVAGHGSASDLASMKYTADKTGGRFYNITNPKNLPQIFIKEAQIVSRSLIQEGDVYQPDVASRLPGPTEGFDALPQIDGYVLTAPREGLAQMPIVVQTGEGPDPIYAYWNYGIGKSIAFTPDLTGRWGGRWASWSEFRKFWEQSIRWVMRPSSPANFMVSTHHEGDKAVVEVEAVEANASFLNFLQTSAVVLGPDNTAQPLALQQTGPGRYRGEFRTAEAGAYLVNVNYAAGAAETAVQGNLQAAVTVPYAREFRAVKHNAALLKDLADSTKGRYYEGDDIRLLDELFDDEQLEVPKSPREIWDLLAIIAAALFVFDVAARRIALDPRWVALMAGRAVGRRGDATTDTVAAWKRTRSQTSHRKAPVTVKAKQPEKPAERSVRFEAAEEDQKHAIDVGAEVPPDMREQAVTPTKPAKPQAAEPDEGEYTSRLLAAKRRAQRGGDSGGPKQDQPNA